MRSWAFKTMCILCVCVVFVYKIQEVALDRMEDLGRELVPPRPVLSTYDVHSLSIHDEDKEEVEDDVGLDTEHKTQVWITMGLCWSANAQVHGKEKFPYKDAAPLSSQLWMKLTNAKVLLQIVYSEPQVSEDLLHYKKEMESYGALVKLVPTGNELKCVLKSQLIRVLAFLLPEIKPWDIIITADVDAFIMTPDIVLPLKLPGKKIWLYRYAFTLGTGSTFMMPFIGAISDVWRNMIDYDATQDDPANGLLGNNLAKMVDTYSAKMNFSDTYTWDIDQHIVSNGILNSNLCSLPGDNKLWTELHIKPNVFDDRMTCWHGSGIYEDCNNVLWSRNIMIRYKGDNCKWWHFYPQETYANLRAKFHEILNGQSENGIVTNILSAAKNMQKKTFGRVLV